MAGLLLRGKPRTEAEARARAWIDRVNLTGHEVKYLHQHSGGLREAAEQLMTAVESRLAKWRPAPLQDTH